MGELMGELPPPGGSSVYCICLPVCLSVCLSVCAAGSPVRVSGYAGYPGTGYCGWYCGCAAATVSQQPQYHYYQWWGAHM